MLPGKGEDTQANAEIHRFCGRVMGLVLVRWKKQRFTETIIIKNGCKLIRVPDPEFDLR